jgi:hypothetical protein
MLKAKGRRRRLVWEIKQDVNEHSYRDSEEAAANAPAPACSPKQESNQSESQYREEAVSQCAVRSERLLHASTCCNDDDRYEQVYVRDNGALDDSEPHGSGSNFC